MRIFTAPRIAATVFACTALMAAAPAFAGADDGGTKGFWSTGSSSATSTPAPRGNEQYRATYTAPSAAPTGSAPESDPEEFYHAKGTMSH